MLIGTICSLVCHVVKYSFKIKKKMFCVLGDVGELEPLKDDETMFVYRGLEDKFKE